MLVKGKTAKVGSTCCMVEKRAATLLRREKFGLLLVGNFKLTLCTVNSVVFDASKVFWRLKRWLVAGGGRRCTVVADAAV